MTKFYERDTTVSLEMIDFQSDSYARDIEVLFSILMKDFSENPNQYRRWKEHPNVKAIEELTFKRMGIKLDLIPNGLPGAVIPFYPNEYSSIINKQLRGNLYDGPLSRAFLSKQLKIIDQALEQKGIVDIQKCEVSGIFSEYTNPLHVNIQTFLKWKLSPGMVTAIFLHELGHCFTAYEYSNRLNSNNQVLSQLLKDTVNKKDLSKDYIFKELKILNPKTTNEELDKIFSGSNTILGRRTMKFLKETIESQMPNDRYNDNASETLADNFTSRWGYGPDLIAALDKMQGSGFLNPDQSLAGSILWSIGSILLITIWTFLFLSLFFEAFLFIIGAGVTSLLTGTGFVFYSLIAGVVLGSYVISHSTYIKPMTYDDLKHRYQRVRNQLIFLLKDSDLPEHQVKETIDQIKLLDEIIQNKNEYKNLVTLLIDFFTPGHKDSQNDIQLQRLLEDLSASDLYLASASLRVAHT